MAPGSLGARVSSGVLSLGASTNERRSDLGSQWVIVIPHHHVYCIQYSNCILSSQVAPLRALWNFSASGKSNLLRLPRIERIGVIDQLCRRALASKIYRYPTMRITDEMRMVWVVATAREVLCQRSKEMAVWSKQDNLSMNCTSRAPGDTYRAGDLEVIPWLRSPELKRSNQLPSPSNCVAVVRFDLICERGTIRMIRVI